MKVSAAMKPVYRMLEFSGIYAVNQMIGKPTTDRFRRHIAENVGDTSVRRVLDVGCGIGNYRDSFGPNYVGIDINPDYIETARQRYGGRFEVMDASKLDFPENSFDDVITIATTHHLTDEEFVAMVAGALAVVGPGGYLHIIDAILPVTPSIAFKQLWFGLDRGRHPRRIEAMVALADRVGRVVTFKVLPGPLHDTGYVRVGRR